MRKNFGSKSWLYPMPVLIVAAYDADGKANAMNAAWGGMFTDEMKLDFEKKSISPRFCLHEAHFILCHF